MAYFSLANTYILSKLQLGLSVISFLWSFLSCYWVFLHLSSVSRHGFCLFFFLEENPSLVSTGSVIYGRLHPLFFFFCLVLENGSESSFSGGVSLSRQFLCSWIQRSLTKWNKQMNRPEYGTGANTSTSGDVYSYGIVLLEMLTGKRPTDDMFENNMRLHEFAKMALPEHAMEIIDHGLLSEENEIIGHSENSNNIRSKMQEALISLVKIGVSCSHESPKERMEMKDVVIEMQKVKDFYLRR